MMLRISGHCTESALPGPTAVLSLWPYIVISLRLEISRDLQKNYYEIYQRIQKLASKMDKYSASVNQHRPIAGSYTSGDFHLQEFCAVG